MQRSKKIGMKARADQVGWILAAVLGGVMLASGFQTAGDKIAVVDLISIATKSNIGVANAAQFDQLKAARQNLLQFVEQNPVITSDQALQLHDLVEKENPTDADKASITQIEGAITTATKSYTDLAAKYSDPASKATPTADEQTQINNARHLADTMSNTEQRWYTEFMQDLQDWSDKHRQDNLNKARDAVAQVAKAQGYTIVFDKGVAPYGANDLSDAALQAMNAQK